MLKVRLRFEATRRRLAAIGLTQLALASMCGVDLRTMQRWFAGQTLRLEDAERIASALQMGTADLFDDVPEFGAEARRSRLGMIHRLLSARDSSVAQIVRVVQQHYAHVLDAIVFRAHPLRGFVYRIPLSAADRNGFLALRITSAPDTTTISVLDQTVTSALFERAKLFLHARDVWLLENFVVHSMRAPYEGLRRFELWHWVGPEPRELVLHADGELSVELLTLTKEARGVFDMASSATACAVCIRPGVSHLRQAGLPSGFDRVANRDAARIDLALPDKL